MALGDKPVDLPRWADAPGRTLEPPESGTSTEMCKDNGYVQGKTPPARWDNWLINLIYLWIAYLDQFEQKARTWIESNLFTAGIVVNRTTGGVGTAVTGTGNGAGDGVSGTGGTTGVGVSGIGGASGSAGVTGLGTGNAAGVTGQGAGTGAGVVGTGGATNAPGVTGAGTGTGSGGSFTGGVSAGAGVTATGGTLGPGVAANGSGSGAGVTATGGSVGAGVIATGGASAGRGVIANGTGGAPAVEVGTGNQIFTGTSPTKSANPGFVNYQSGANIIHARGTYRFVSGGTSDTDRLLDGFDVSVVTSGATVTVTFTRPMSDANYSLTARQTMPHHTGTTVFKYIEIPDGDKTANGFEVHLWDLDMTTGAATLANWAANQGFEFIVSGRQ